MEYTAALLHRVVLHLLEYKLLVHLIQDRLPAPGRFPYSFREVLWVLQSPSYWVRLGQWLNVPMYTQGWRVLAQTEGEMPNLLTNGSGIISPAQNRTQAALLGGRHTTNQPNEHAHSNIGQSGVGGGGGGGGSHHTGKQFSTCKLTEKKFCRNSLDSKIRCSAAIVSIKYSIQVGAINIKMKTPIFKFVLFSSATIFPVSLIG